MTNLVILRHGNTFDSGDVVRRVGARTDLPLSSSGRDQVNAAAIALKNRDCGFRRILSSPLSRAMETAEAVRLACAPDLAIETTEALREIDYGPDENMPEEDVVSRIGADALDAWERENLPPPGWRVDAKKLVGAWRALFNEVSEGAPTLAVTSNGVARFAIVAADEAPPEIASKLKTAAFGVIDVSATCVARVVEWNVRI